MNNNLNKESKMNNKVVFITGANRGIGFELTRQYLLAGAKVIASCRDVHQATDLTALRERHSDQLLIEAMDISCPEKIKKLADNLKNNQITIDAIINNAGYLDRKNNSIHHVDYDSAEQCFKVNSLGPLYLIHCLLPLLKQEELSKIVIISSVMGSVSIEQPVDWYGYRMSKAAANMLTLNLAQELSQENKVVAAIHPGWVQTDMGGQSARENVGNSAAGIMKVIKKLSISETGKFFNFNGDTLAF